MEAADHECRSRQYGRRRQRRWPVPSVPVAPRPEEDQQGTEEYAEPQCREPRTDPARLHAGSNLESLPEQRAGDEPDRDDDEFDALAGSAVDGDHTDGIVHVTCQQADSQQGKHGGRRHYKNCGGAHSRAGLRRTCPRRLRAARDRRRALAAGTAARPRAVCRGVRRGCPRAVRSALGGPALGIPPVLQHTAGCTAGPLFQKAGTRRPDPIRTH